MASISTTPTFVRAKAASVATPTAMSIFTAVCITLAAAMVGDTVSTIIRLHSPLPYWDEWGSLTAFSSVLTGQQPWHDMFSQHNEHRIFFPRLILFSDYLFFGGRGILNLVSIFAIQVAHVAMLIALLRASRPRARGSLAIAALVVVLLFSLRQEENFSWGFEVQFVGVFAAATLSFLLFARALARADHGQPFVARLAGAYAAAAVATFSMANGLLSPLILVGLAVVSRASRSIVIASALVALVLASAYLYGYEPVPGHTPLGFSLRHPFRVLFYTATYLGNFLDPDVASARHLGLWGLLAAAGAGWRIVSGRDIQPARLALFGVMVFAGGAALVTALGRLGFGVDQAFSSRYSTGSGAYWAAVLIYWWSVSGEMWPVLLRGAVALTGLVLFAGAAQAQSDMKYGMEDRAYGQAEATNALLLGLRDRESFDTVNDEDKLVMEESDLLRQRGISIFGEKDARLHGQPLSQAGALVPGTDCKGSVDSASSAPDLGRDGVKISGQAWGLKHNRLTGRVYIVDAQDRIIGYASRESPFKDPSTWHGFAVAPPNAPLRAFALLWHGELCPIGGASVSSEAAAAR